ncbi:conserved hypothetical protein [Burkholderia sp. H160]|nr:conserved hypothetical protein [Burkholderia sp. H160]
MSALIDSDQALLEMEHALLKRFDFPSTAIKHTFVSSGILTIQVSWVAVPATMNILDNRCMLNFTFAPNVLDRYRSLESAARVRFRDKLSVIAVDEVRRHPAQVGNEIVNCNLTVAVDASMVEAAARK